MQLAQVPHDSYSQAQAYEQKPCEVELPILPAREVSKNSGVAMSRCVPGLVPATADCFSSHKPGQNMAFYEVGSLKLFSDIISERVFLSSC